MEKLNAWILSIAGVALLGVLLDLIVAEGKTQKYIRSIFGIISVVVIAAPLASLVNGGWEIDFGKDNAIPAGPQIDSNYLASIYKNKVGLMESGLEKYLAENGYEKATVSITVDSYTEKMRITAVSIGLKNAVISESKKHIDKYTEVGRLAKAYLNVEKEVVFCSG